MKDIRYILAKFIKQKRKDDGLSMRKLDKKSGHSTSMIHRIERGDINPSFLSIVNIFNALNTDISEFDLFLKKD